MWWYRAPRRVRQELWRIWRGHTRAAPLRHLVGRGLSLRRYGLRVMLSARNASSPARARRRWEFHRRWWRQLEEAQKYPDGSGQVVNVLAMAASYDPDPAQFFGIRLPVTFDTCEVIEERWANWLRQDPVVAIETQASNLRRLKALYIDCGEKDQFNLLYGARKFVRRLNEAFRMAGSSVPLY